MRTSQEIADALAERMKTAMQNGAPVTPVDRSAEIFPGKRYRDERGRMVTVKRVSLLAVEYSREGYRGTSKMGAREFKMKFTEVM